jgi:hypothetical protein
MTERRGYQVSEEAKRFINQAFADGVGDTLQKLAEQSPDPQVVPAGERRAQLLLKIASGVPLHQIAEETQKKERRVYERYREALRDLWNQSPPDTQKGFSTRQVFAPPKRDNTLQKKG